MSFGDLSVNKGNRPANNFVQKDEFGQLSDSLQVFQVELFSIIQSQYGVLFMRFIFRKVVFRLKIELVRCVEEKLDLQKRMSTTFNLF